MLTKMILKRNSDSHVNAIKAGMVFSMFMIFALCLTSCGSASGTDGILLIDEMAQIDFDIDYPVGQITSGVVVTQDFISNADTIRQIWLYGATYMRDNTATVEIKLYASDSLISSWTINSAEMEDNTIIKLDVPDSDTNTGLNGAQCLIEISSPDGEPDLSPTFWITEEDVYPDGHLSINGYQQYNDIWFQVVGE